MNWIAVQLFKTLKRMGKSKFRFRWSCLGPGTVRILLTLFLLQLQQNRALS